MRIVFRYFLRDFGAFKLSSSILSFSLHTNEALSKFNGNFIRIQSPYLWNFSNFSACKCPSWRERKKEMKKKYFSFFAIKKAMLSRLYFFAIIFISSIFEILNHSGGKIFRFSTFFYIFIFFFTFISMMMEMKKNTTKEDSMFAHSDSVAVVKFK